MRLVSLFVVHSGVGLRRNDMLKLKWKVGDIPVGRYSSFEKRAWPSADYADGRIAAYITCEDAYKPDRARTGAHKPLTLHIADYSKPSNTTTGSGWTWVKATQTYLTLSEARQATLNILNQYPHLRTGITGE
jgi:hypothetical protein